MEDYKDLENGAPNALNATDATSNAGGPTNAVFHDSVQIARQPELEAFTRLVGKRKSYGFKQREFGETVESDASGHTSHRGSK